MNRPGAKDCAQLVRRERLVAILRPRSREEALESTSMLLEERYAALEISLSQDCALEALGDVRAAHPDAVVGVGTVLTVNDAQRAVDAGAAFLVSPGLRTDVVEWAASQDLLHVPGVMTPTEIMAARRTGAELLKVFPAVTLQPSFVSQVLAPFPGVELVATGGVDETNAQAFLDAGAVALGVGSAVANDRQAARRLRALVPPTSED